ncbi:MAG: aminoacyl-tRNA hydrolase [Peptococcaceae bacterium]|mgnify:FL=1|jgi:PTH1 family peptidyl-tRNA hydrolase|nr:aminoacyl-tRNA hydrolase [Peptococcaceae bacterium]
MKAVIGLGNPGLKYRNTRHNVGFRLLDTLVKETGFSYRDDFRGKLAEGRLNNKRIFFLKPYTFMNLSGLAVRELAGFYKIPGQDILVIHDDMDLSLGKLRLRAKGSAGGHNGLKSIISELGTQDFWRLKIGVGRPKEGWDVVNHVLSSFNKEEEKVLAEILDQAYQAVNLWLEDKGIEAMNKFN